MRAVRDAFIAELETVLPGAVFKSYSVKNAPSRYAVIWIEHSEKPNTRFTAGQNADIYTITVHCVGNNEDSALWVQEKVNALTNTKLTVPGRAMRPIRYITGQACQLDEDGDQPLWWAVSQFDIQAD